MMIKRVKVYFVCLLLCALSGCTNEDEYRLPDLSVPEITGYIQRDEVGSLLGNFGLPNVKLESQDGIAISSFPNPSKDILSIAVINDFKNLTKKMWMVKANYIDPSSVGFMDIGNTYIMEAGGAPIIHGEFSENLIQIDVSALYPGYYRLYVLVDDVLLYDNIAIR